MFSRTYFVKDNTPVVATITVGKMVQVDGNTECACRLRLQGKNIDYDMTLIGIDQIQALENALLLLHTLEDKEQLHLDSDD